MRIVHVVARLNDGGPARIIAALAHAHRAAGHEVHVLAGACAADERDVGNELLPGLVEQLTGLGRRVSPFDDLRALNDLVKQLRELAPDVVHTHTAKAGVLGRLACRHLGLPCLHTYHGHVLHGYWPRAIHTALAVAERACAGNAWHHALTPTQTIELRDHHHIGRPQRWICLPPPVPAVTPIHAAWHDQLPQDRKRVLWLGRFAPVKDPTLWLDTVAALNRLIPVHALMCGDGALRPAAEARARELGLSATWTGYVPAGEALGAADLLLLSSRNEGLPLSAVEAAGAGISVVSPLVGGLFDAARWGLVRGADRNPLALATAAAVTLTAPRPAPHLLARALAGPRIAARYLAIYRRCASTPFSS
ncbi:MAG: glycosyltransferase family 4 protein [Planctomycetota bacterium]